MKIPPMHDPVHFFDLASPIPQTVKMLLLFTVLDYKLCFHNTISNYYYFLSPLRYSDLSRNIMKKKKKPINYLVTKN